MTTVPTTPRSDFVNWAIAHRGIFLDNAAAIGLTTAQATLFKNAADAAVEAWNAQIEARNAAKAATENASIVFANLRAVSSEMVRTIRTFAENTNNPEVYVIAQVPPRKNPSVAPPPAKPTELTVNLVPDTGDLELRWKATNPRGTQGTSYIIRRRLPGQATFAFVGVSGTKRYVDDTFFAGPESVQYTVQGQRADRSGPVSAIFTVQFGRVGPGGSLTVTAEPEDGEEVRIAA